METSGTAPRVAVSAATAPELASLFGDDGPFVTVYLDTQAQTENAAQKTTVRWTNARRDLEEAGAPDAALAPIDTLIVDGAHTDGQTLAVISSPEGLLYVGHEPEPPKRDLARVAPLPSIGTLLEWRQQSPAHVVVLADRRGADIVAVRYEQPEIERQVETPADEPDLRKSAPGGWSQRRYQQRAENAWDATAEEVAAAVTKLAKRVDARFIAVAGDVRVVPMLRDALAPELQAKLVEVEGGRGQDGSDGAIAEQVVRCAATVAAEDTVAVLQKFREELGQHDRAADGVARTIEALQRAQVDILLVHDDPDDSRSVWFGPEAVHVATDAATLKAMGVDSPQEGRLVDVLIRSAFGTGAGVRIVPSGGGPTDGAGAILRF